MKEKEIKDFIKNEFEGIKEYDIYGPFWSARNLAKLYGYKSFKESKKVIELAILTCKKGRISVEDNFEYVHELAPECRIGDGTREDYKLSEIACFLIASNADSSKKPVLLMQNYLVLSTMKAEAAEKAMREFKMPSFNKEEC